MNIGEAAKRSGVAAKTIRYYEEIDLLPPATRAENGYRSYTTEAVETLRFISQARRLGFSVAECRDLLMLYQDRNRASADVKALTLSHIAEIDKRLAELHEIRATLVDLSEQCRGDSRPDCPILKGLAQS